MPERAEEIFNLPSLILCEGPEDVSFFGELIKNRGLPNCHVRHTGKTKGDRGGNSQFGERLRSFRVGRNNFHKVARILIASDSDENAAEAFAAIQTQLAQANFPVPSAPMMTEPGNPSITILMLPFVGKGNLELMCEPAARSVWPDIAAFVDQFIDTIGAGGWTTCQKAKLWLRVFTASKWRRDPAINLAPLFKKQGNPVVIPMDHNSFNQLSNFILSWAS